MCIRDRRRIPAAIGLGPIDLRLTGRLHAALLDESSDDVAVALGPHASRPARGESLAVPLLVHRLGLAVDPAVAQRDVERLRVVDAADPRRLSGELDPDALHLSM